MKLPSKNLKMHLILTIKIQAFGWVKKFQYNSIKSPIRYYKVDCKDF